MYTIATQPENRYCNFFNYVVQLIGEKDALYAECMYTLAGCICDKITISFKKGERLYSFKDFGSICTEYKNYLPHCILTVKLSEGPWDLQKADVRFVLSGKGIRIEVDSESDYTAEIIGEIVVDKQESVSAVSFDNDCADIRSAYGPAVSKIDNALFDRDHDRAIRFKSEDFRLKYNFDKKKYYFTAKNELLIWIEEHVFERRFHVKYKGINKKNTFPTPPAGWMTWYAVKFDACEKTVLENAEKQKQLFGDYGANTIWVDWEWYHSGLHIADGDPGIHFFSPDSVRYPNGLKHVSEKIKELGFIPSLWVGPTQEPTITPFIEKNEHSVYADLLTWCGRYFYDITNQSYLEKFVPRAFEQVKEWGYEALKWDIIPNTLKYADIFHSSLSDPSISSEQALRKIVQIARDVVGKDFYMLSCSGAWDRSILFAGDIFDAARIGEDIFGWDEFINDCLFRVMRYYSYHNNMFYCDPDNLVVRPEFNTYDQAITRTSLVSLLGLPITFGDDLRELPEDRVEIIRRALPPLDIRPMDIREPIEIGEDVIINLHIAKHFEEWNVVQVMNILPKEKTITVKFDKDLHLDAGQYILYDFWRHEYIGIRDDEVTMVVPPCGSSVISIHKYTGKKQVISTSRHISNGAFDLIDLWLDDKDVLHGKSKVVAGEPYIITIYDPEKQDVFEKVLQTEITGEIKWDF